MFAILHALGMFVVDLFKSRSRLKPRICFFAISKCQEREIGVKLVGTLEFSLIALCADIVLIVA
jgi:hypothetical protein